MLCCKDERCQFKSLISNIKEKTHTKNKMLKIIFENNKTNSIK